MRRFSAGFGSTAAACSNPTGSASSRTRRAAAVLPEPGGPLKPPSPGSGGARRTCGRGARRRGGAAVLARAAGRRTPPATPRLPVRAQASHSRAAPSPRARPGNMERPARAFWRRSRTGGGGARPGPPTGHGRQSRRASQTRSARSPSSLARSRCAASAGVM